MEVIPDGPMMTAMEVTDHNMSVSQASNPLGTHAETINSSAQSSLGELPQQISMAVPQTLIPPQIGTTILGVGPI
eukprot:3548484-Amphidinium_carterae.1